MIKPWLFEFFHSLDFFSSDTSPTRQASLVNEHFDWYLDLWTRDEALGFEGIFFSEHHFGSGYSPSPNLIIAAMAGRTRTLRLGALGSVAPYASPWRVVEEIGILDHLTHGRLEIGLVRGLPRELAAVGIDGTEAAERYVEIVAVLDQALSSPHVSHQGKHWKFDNLNLVPRALQQPHPPVWTAVGSASSAAWAGRRNSKVCDGFYSCAKINEHFDAYRAAASAAGHPATIDQLAIRRQIRLVRDEAEVPQARVAMRHVLLGIAQSSMVSPGPKLLDSDLFAEDDEFIAGTSSSVAEQIIEQCRAVGAGNILATFYETDREAIRAQHTQFGREVIPLLREAHVG